MNVELLRQVQAKIREHPEHFSMRAWASGSSGIRLVESAFLRSCNTEACIAGWAVILTGCLAEYEIGFWRLEEDVANEGRAILGLSCEEAEHLFYEEDWPEEFENRYEEAPGDENWELAAQVACERIERFIATEGRE